MDLEDLRSFEVLAEELSFTAAARRLHVSQPTLSKRLQRLERRLGVTLVERTTSTVSLTPAGAWLLSRATGLLGGWQSVTDQVRLLADGGPVGRTRGRRPLQVTVGGLGTGTLQPYLSAAMLDHDVSVLAMPVAQALDRLGRGDGVDAVVVNDPPGPWSHPPVPAAHVATIALEPLWVMLSARHPLAARDELTVEEIVAHGLPWIVGPSDDPIGQWEVPYLRGRAPRARFEHVITQSSHMQIARGQAVELATPLIPANELVTLRPLTPAVTMHAYLTWQPHRLPESVATGLLAAMRGFHRHRAQQHPRYWRWLRDHPGHFPGIGPDLPSGPVPVGDAVEA